MHDLGERSLVLCARFYWVTTRLVARYLLLPIVFRSWRRKKARLSSPASRRTPLAELGLDSDQLSAVTARLQTQSHVVLGEFDRDSLLHPHVGPLPGIHDVTDEFQPRRNTRLQLVATADGVGVRKYHQNRWRFLCELRALQALEATDSRIPSVLDADFEHLAITSTFIPGTVLTERLAAHSPGVRDRDVRTLDVYEGIGGRRRWRARIKEGNRVLHRAVPRDFGRQVLHELQRIHAARVIWGDVKFGNIIVDRPAQRPWLLDFDYAGHLPRLWEPLFRALCRRELAYFELHFGKDARCANGASDGGGAQPLDGLLRPGNAP
ncbi:MAG TPA: hypothetical protein VFV95_04695 [Vicinamibacterales bacterium]|nr:hypothetical protein [Vicinamibacterales bacterium]